MTRRLPLPTLLSFALVAFTLECDNEVEHWAPHRTTHYGPSAEAEAGLWAVSMVMWFNCLRFVPEEGVVIREVERLARTRTNWDGMRPWGYVYFEPDPGDKRSKPPQSALVVRATAKGRKAQEVWREVLVAVEDRWRERFDGGAIDELRRALVAVANQFEVPLPDCMPILKYGLLGEGPKAARSARSEKDLTGLCLPALLARVLLAFALEFERESDVSLAICANVLQVLRDEGTAIRDLPILSGVSKEAIAMALGFLAKRGYVSVLTERRVKKVIPGPAGVQARENGERWLGAIEGRWGKRYGADTIEALKKALERIAGDGTSEGSPLFAGLDPWPEGWRARMPKPTTLPHYPMVLHRGGYPDGS